MFIGYTKYYNENIFQDPFGRHYYYYNRAALYNMDIVHENLLFIFFYLKI